MIAAAYRLITSSSVHR